MARLPLAMSLVGQSNLIDNLRYPGTLPKGVRAMVQVIQRLDCSREFTALNFQLRQYRDSSGKSNPFVEMTRDGFIFLAMGFNGTHAIGPFSPPG